MRCIDKKNLWGTWTINDKSYLLAAVTYAGLVLSAGYLQFLLTADYVTCTSVIFEGTGSGFRTIYIVNFYTNGKDLSQSKCIGSIHL